MNFPALLKYLPAINIEVLSCTAMMAHEQLNSCYKCQAAVQRVVEESSTIVAYHLQYPAVLITWPESIYTHPVLPATKT